ncbi:cytochrome-c oxidase, cbb3-type subunit III [Amorphus orientalis]|uniref:Cbb3-type cytochrome c oxidase subunit n=1 Tax=Amorphus orientalis TaxID=649198 RepID=A0AAE3VMZ5_9HYPH|nr:cytochrome-c oxidase, cbb3-type subunit III [Amorphus orientalis]MDQ0315094.1 cytochrome c oxidase cbb3-type subunit 3 [Amorphus orientalis]
MAKKEIDAVSGVETTGHDWDGLKELNNPLPRWWLWVFYATIVYAIVYWILMPAWPLLNGYTPGLLGNNQREQGEIAYEEVVDQRSEIGKEIATADLSAIVQDASMLEFATAQGEAAFGDNCAPCHGSGATGGPGYPNLQDDAWLWGGSLEAIHTTLQHGIRAEDPNTRLGEMTAFGDLGILDRAQIRDVTSYVRTLSGLEPASNVDVANGEEIFAQNCAACHGADGKGNQDLGAPNLTDQIWLYGGDIETIVQTITHGRAGVMPAWSERLDPTTVKSLTVYVHGLGGGQ